MRLIEKKLSYLGEKFTVRLEKDTVNGGLKLEMYSSVGFNFFQSSHGNKGIHAIYLNHLEMEKAIKEKKIELKLPLEELKNVKNTIILCFKRWKTAIRNLENFNLELLIED